MPDSPADPPSAARVAAVCALAGVVAFVAALAGAPGRATNGARTTADEPYYLLSALSLAEDGDLDISDELEARAYAPFHEIPVDPQTVALDDSGVRLSPHDPLLPALLAPAMRLGGWLLAKATLAAIAAITASLACWTAHRRFDVSLVTAGLTIAMFASGMPWAPYGSQVYPELPAALAVLVAVAAATHPALVRRGHGTSQEESVRRLAERWTLGGALAIVVLAVVALPWLSVKYVPVAAALTIATGWRLARRRHIAPLLAASAALAVAGVAYLVVHHRIYGGWTVYAAGDHFVATGEFSVVGTDPDYVARSRRLVGLLVDREFGLAPWSPVWLLAPAAVGAALQGRHRSLLLGPIAAGWATATWVALTMHGWWMPGRQVVVVVPLLAIATAGLVDRWPRARPLLLVAGAVGAANWVWLAVEAATDRRTLVVDFFDTAAVGYRSVRWAFPAGRSGSGSPALLAAWSAAAAVSLLATAWRARTSPPR